MEKLILPTTYSEWMWKRGGSVESHKKFLGKPMLSWSQVEMYSSKKGFNTGLPGNLEYILKYCFKRKYPDLGWGEFGQDVESYIQNKSYSEKFTEAEKKVLDQIKPLGNAQTEIVYHDKELDFVVVGYIDDHTDIVNGEIELLLDYKTKSESSKKDLHDKAKHQMEIYVLGLQQEGVKVKNCRYTIIERLGGKECMDGGGRKSLSVGEQVWLEPYEYSRIEEKRLNQTKRLIRKTAKEVSSYYKTYVKYFKQ